MLDAIPKSGDKKTIGIAMSGGVDSSTVAHLMKSVGYEIIGLHMHLVKYTNSCSRACCSLDTVEDARRVANQLDIPFYVLNMEEEFEEKVINPSRQAYKLGRTPNPCIWCNEHMKFKLLMDRAMDLGCTNLATGHYVRKIDDRIAGDYLLKTAIDQSKDQSYFLYFLDQEQLGKLMFPLGWFTKEGTRKMAEKAGLKVYDKPDSQDLCFDLTVGEPSEEESGKIVDEKGMIIGSHRGIKYFTIGQRKGLNLAVGYPLYVKAIDAESKKVTVAPDGRILARGFSALDIKLINSTAKEKIKSRDNLVRVKVRYRSDSELARVKFLDKGRAEFEFIRPVRAVCPGQAAVMYIHEDVLGGGIINRIIY